MKICTDSSEIRTMALQRLTTPFESSVTKINISEPAPTNHYNYEWSLISGPSMENAGSMENRQNQTLSLNDLQEGVYQFKVIWMSFRALFLTNYCITETNRVTLWHQATWLKGIQIHHLNQVPVNIRCYGH